MRSILIFKCREGSKFTAISETKALISFMGSTVMFKMVGHCSDEVFLSHVVNDVLWQAAILSPNRNDILCSSNRASAMTMIANKDINK